MWHWQWPIVNCDGSLFNSLWCHEYFWPVWQPCTLHLWCHEYFWPAWQLCTLHLWCHEYFWPAWQLCTLHLWCHEYFWPAWQMCTQHHEPSLFCSSAYQSKHTYYMAVALISPVWSITRKTVWKKCFGCINIDRTSLQTEVYTQCLGFQASMCMLLWSPLSLVACATVPGRSCPRLGHQAWSVQSASWVKSEPGHSCPRLITMRCSVSQLGQARARSLLS